LRVKLKGLFPPEEQNSRSIWRETKFLKFVLSTNLFNLSAVIAKFKTIAGALKIESRRSRQGLQMAAGLA
jgi:hypothetical protein